MSQTLADEFHSLWDAPPDLFAFLAGRKEATPRDCAEVVAVDLFRRWRAGVPLPLEEYFNRIVPLAGCPDLKLELVLREIEYRELYGENASLEEFAARFPDLAERLREELACSRDESISVASPPERTVGEGDVSEPTVLVSGPPPGALSGSSTFVPHDGRRHGRATEPQPFLSQSETFASLPSDVLRLVESNMFLHHFAAGETILRQGEPGSSLLVIREGVVEITTSDETGLSHFIGRIGSGQVLGEMSLLTEEPRTANAIATTDVDMLVLPAGIFHELASLYPAISVVLTRLFATRLGGVGRDVLAGKTFGGYRFERHLGQGGMGVVYEATHVKTGRKAALKMMSHRLVYDAEALTQFQREADIIESFDHPNIVTTFGRFAAFHTYFIAMQFCDGYTLEDVVNAAGPLGEAEFRRIIGQVAAALDHAHGENVIHRDVKPANIMLNRDGSVKLMDFGLAKPVESDAIRADVSIVGTPRYMAPEQLAGHRTGKQTDYFALGLVAYKMLTGRTLFTGRGVSDIRREHLRYRTPDFREACAGVSIASNWLLEQCLARDPAQRRPDLKRVAAWAAPFDPGLLQCVTRKPQGDVTSDETYVE